MTSSHDESQVRTLLEFTGHAFSHDQAAQLLKISNNDIELAMEKYFGAGGDIEKLLEQASTQWDSTAFGGDRYGGNDAGGTVPSFHIEYAPGVDHYPHSNGPSAAPTRPSSRTSQQSALITHAGDRPQDSRAHDSHAEPQWTADHSAGIETEQEVGVTGGSRSFFGPANKPNGYYNPADWAMVTTAQSTEYIPDASLLDQSRSPDVPSFIKPIPSTDYLPALITILATIPLLRNMLLASKLSMEDYWLGDEWWKGSALMRARTIDTVSNANSTAELELLYEVQRLVAFLEMTERSYASLETLLQLDVWTGARDDLGSLEDAEDVLVKFFLKWSRAYQKHIPVTIFDGVIRSTINVGGNEVRSFVLDASVAPVAHSGPRTLYDVLDDALFVSEERSAHISQISNVLVLRLTGSSNNIVDCLIPARIYADRYLDEHRGVVENLFASKRTHAEKMSAIQSRVEDIKFHTPSRTELPRRMETLTMLKTSMKAFEHHNESSEMETGQISPIAQLQSLYDNIEQELADLEEEKRSIQETLNDISERFRAPLDPPIETTTTSETGAAMHSFLHPYDLCGLATSPNDYYIQHRTMSPTGQAFFQWWHLRYTYSGDEASIYRDRVSLSDVTSAASSSSSRILLVYANETATTTTMPETLSPTLADFVSRDNKSFLQALEQMESDYAEYGVNDGKVRGDWDRTTDPPDTTASGAAASYEADGIAGGSWQTVSAQDYLVHDHEPVDSTMSSTTLTPNTEIEETDEGAEAEMKMQESDRDGIGSSTLADAEMAGLGVTVDYDKMDLVEEDASHNGPLKADDEKIEARMAPPGIKQSSPGDPPGDPSRKGG